MTVRTRHLPTLNVLIITDGEGQQFVLPRHQAAAFLAEFMGVLAATVPDMADSDDPGLPLFPAPADPTPRTGDTPPLRALAAQEASGEGAGHSVKVAPALRLVGGDV